MTQADFMIMPEGFRCDIGDIVSTDLTQFLLSQLHFIVLRLCIVLGVYSIN